MVIITNYEQMQIPPSMMESKERPPQLKKPMKMNKLLLKLHLPLYVALTGTGK
jgi:hypothetical protein